MINIATLAVWRGTLGRTLFPCIHGLQTLPGLRRVIVAGSCQMISFMPWPAYPTEKVSRDIMYSESGSGRNAEGMAAQN